MTSSIVATDNKHEALVERIVTAGDLGVLTPAERVQYYVAVCERYGLDPVSKPFDYISTIEGEGEDRRAKISLYPNQIAAAQLRARHKISVQIVSREVVEGCYCVIARGSTPDGRFDESIGIVALEGGKYGPLKGQSRANAMMKAEGKARRRVTMALAGLSFDESDDEEVGRIMKAEAYDPPSDVIYDVEPVGTPSDFDRAPTYAAIEANMKKLGWKKSTAVEFLKSSYGGKPTRDDLDDGELIDFADFLDRQVAALQEVAS
ncbi:hypothetical protein [Pantanalinema sp. GBBB05]|uniref:hypothetical protein n=1 Tax=Pantanalinema sp. GBBB05 TaxID=2604139 RepID=UPI001D5A6577|nr:hypothetical protein [Pantanalinema sp. GBBB05]